jgi:hypothetical protein
MQQTTARRERFPISTSAISVVATNRIDGRVIVFAALPSVKLGLSEGADEDRSSSRRRGAIAPDIVLLKAPMKAETTSLRCWAVKPISRSKSSFGGLFQKPPTITISSVYRSILGSVVGQRRNPTAIRNDHRKPAALP